jgi:hypothetical protein
MREEPGTEGPTGGILETISLGFCELVGRGVKGDLHATWVSDMALVEPLKLAVLLQAQRKWCSAHWHFLPSSRITKHTLPVSSVEKGLLPCLP